MGWLSCCTERFGYGARLGLSKVALMAFLVPAWAEPVTLLAFGDSLTQGYGLPAEDGFVPQMQRYLTQAGAEVEIVNGGVSGDTTAGGLARIDWSLTPEVDAMILALGANDMLRGIDPAVTRANLDGILQAAGDLPVLVVGLSAPGNYGPEYKAAFDAAFPELAATHGALHFESFFKGLTDAGGDVTRYMQPDGIHPGAEGVALIVAAMGPAVLELLGRVD